MSLPAVVIGLVGATLALGAAGHWGERLTYLARGTLGLLLRGRDRRKLEEALGPALRLFADSLDAGLTIPAAGSRVGEGTDPAARSLSAFARDCSRGLTVVEALGRLTATPNGDLWASTAFTVELHFRQGGDLAAAVRRLAEEFESRRQSRNGAAAATSQARFTANLVCAMPLLALAGAALLFPGRVAAAGTNPISLMLMFTGLIFQLGSLLAIRRITRTA